MKKNRYQHFRHPKVQVQKNLSHFWSSIAAISQQLPSVQLLLCFWKIKQQKTSPETSHFLYRFSLIFTSFPNLPQLKPSPSLKQVHQSTQEKQQICTGSQHSRGSFSSQYCSWTTAVSSTACPIVPLPTAAWDRDCFLWNCLALIPLPGDSLCSLLRGVLLSLNSLAVTTACCLLLSKLENLLPSLSLSLYVPPPRGCLLGSL